MTLNNLARHAPGRPLVVVLGTCSDDPEAYAGRDVQLGKSVEWQVSDGVPGERGSSQDFVDPIDVIASFRESDVRGAFISPQEAVVFLRDLALRLSGVPVSQIDVTPPADFFGPEDAVDEGAPDKAMEIIREAAITGVTGRARQVLAIDLGVLLNVVTDPGTRDSAEQIETSLKEIAAISPDDMLIFRKALDQSLACYLSEPKDASPSP